MHDMRIAFDHHEIRDLHGAGQGDASEFVAAQVHEHQVFRAFFLVLQQGVGVFAVLLFGRAAGPGAGDGSQAGGASVEPDHGFRRGADQRAALRLQEKEVGGRVDIALGTVEAHQVVRRGADEALRDDALDDVALVDMVFDGLHHSREVLGRVHRRGRDGRVPRRTQGGGGRTFERSEQVVDAGGGGVIERVGLAVLGEGEGEDGEGVGDVVEDQQRIGDDELGERAFWRQAIGHARFEKVDHFVGEIADKPAAEAWQSGKFGELIRLHEGPQHLQRRTVVRGARLADAVAVHDIVTVDGDGGACGDAQETVAAPLFAALRALEQEHVGAGVGETGQYRNGRFGVGQDLGADRDDGGMASVFAELVRRGECVEQHKVSVQATKA